MAQTAATGTGKLFEKDVYEVEAQVRPQPCAKPGFSKVRQGDICGMPFPSDSFDARFWRRTSLSTSPTTVLRFAKLVASYGRAVLSSPSAHHGRSGLPAALLVWSSLAADRVCVTPSLPLC